MNARPKPRRGFTLLETMLAAAIGALVVLACIGMFFLMSRTDRALDARASEQAELERLHWVMERTFSRLLMSDESRTPKPGDVNVAVPVDATQLNLRDGAAGAAGAAGKDAAGNAAGTDRFSGGGDRFSSNASSSGGRFATDKSGSGGSTGSGGDRFSSDKSGSGRFASDKNGAGGAGGKGGGPGDDSDPKNKNLRQPPPPRMVLDADPAESMTMIHRPTPGDPPQEVGPPQRLEVVLFDSPVPTDAVDPVEKALSAPRSGSSHSRSFIADGLNSNSGGAASDTSAADKAAKQQDQVDAMSMPTRAIRGSFEVRPQPRHHAEVPGGQVTQAAMQGEPTGLWQVWWTPLPRIGSDGTVEVPPTDTTSRDQVARPFLVASNLRYIKWTVFQDRQRKTALTSIWSGDLPAYVEVEAETASGLTVNWMFEIDWAVGPEVPHPPTTPGTNPLGDNSKAADVAGDLNSAPQGLTGGAATKGGK